MATEIGIIKTLIGTAVATASDGSQRTLQAGDKVFQDEIITTGAAGAVEVEFSDGSLMTLGRSSQTLLDIDAFDPQAVAQAPTAAVDSEVDALQQALLEGADPSQIGEATAAGAGAGAGGNEGTDFVQVLYEAPEVTPESGFETTGITLEFDEEREEVPFDDAPTAGITTVLLDEDDLYDFRNGGSEEDHEELKAAFDAIKSDFETAEELSAHPHKANGPGLNDEQEGDDLPPDAKVFVSSLLNVDFGADGPGDIVFNAEGTQPAGLTSGGEDIQYWVSADGHSLVAYIEYDHGRGKGPQGGYQGEDGGEDSESEAHAHIIFTAEITDVTTGEFQVMLLGPVDHPDGTSEDNLFVNLGFTISDLDGDTAAGVLRLDIDDDSPVIVDDYYQGGEDNDRGEDGPKGPPGEGEDLTVDEDDIDGRGNDDRAPGDDYSNNYQHLSLNFGADGPAADDPIALSPEGIVDQYGNALTSNGVELQYTWDADSDTLIGYTDDVNSPVLTILVEDVYQDGAGVYIDLFDNLDHPQNSYEDNLEFNVTYTVTDFDGDSVSSTFAVDIDDDMPTIVPQRGSVDEEGLPTGNAGDSYNTETVTGGVLVIPELERNSNLHSDLSPEAKDTIRSFVDGGGNMVVSYHIGLINDVFGLSLTTSHGGTYSITPETVGTSFASGPGSVGSPSATTGLSIASLPVGSEVMYANGGSAAVVVIPVGAGQITFIGWDWFNAAPLGSADGGWLDVLDNAVSQGGSPADVSVFDNGSYVDTSGGSGSESDTIQATLNSQGHNVTTFTGITAADFADALQVTIGDLPGEDLTAQGSLGIGWGADDRDVDGTDAANPEYDRSVSFDAQSAPEGLTSNGLDVHYMISEDGTLLTAYTGESGEGDYHEVFTVAITDEGTGTYDFTLLDNLDHPEGATTGEDSSPGTEDDINLSFDFTATDSDGDAVGSHFTITVDDDAPVATDTTVSATVDEDDIKTSDSQGNHPNDNNGDGSYTGSASKWWDSGPANVSGSVESLVSFGADEDGSFSLSTDFGDIEAQGLLSKGDALSYEVSGDTLTATAGGRTVFTLQVESDGDYKFSLYDQLDHALGEGQNNLALDLSSLIVATDSDGDSITLDSAFTMNVTDDVPEEARYTPTVGIVEEEALPAGNPEENDWSWYGYPLDGWPDTDTASGSVSGQVSGGADDNISFSLSMDAANLPSLTSNEVPVTYGVEGSVLTATAGDATIFTLGLNESGHYIFVLSGPIDHPENHNEDVLAIDLSTFIVATDNDGDSITLNGNDLIIKVVDDVPVIDVAEAEEADMPTLTTQDAETGDSVVVDGFATINLQGDDSNSDIYELGIENAGKAVTIDFDAAAFGGWDETGTYQDDFIVTVNGVQQVFTHEQDATHYTLNAIANGAGQVTIEFATDVTASEEGVNVSNLSLATVADVDVDSGSFAGLFTLTSNMGADEGGVAPSLSYALSIGDADSGLSSDGEAITLAMNNGVIEGSTSAGVIFSVSVDTATGEVTSTQYEVIDHIDEALDGDATNNDVNNLGLALNNVVLTASATIVDGDGDSASDSQAIDISGAISFDDDIPGQPADINKTVQESGESNDTNLMIVLDLSGSMDDAPGIPGFATRLAVAKDAIDQLISSYDDKGDVMVRIVTFHDHAHTIEGTWMTATAASDYITALGDYAGNDSTNYDAALADAQTAFASSGKIVGGENVSYFLSDGQPTSGSGQSGPGSSGGDGIGATEQSNWETFLNTNNITSHALGLGSGVSATALEPIAYDGDAGEEMPAVIVDDLADLAAVLAATVGGPDIDGNLVSEGLLSGDFGADGPADLQIVAFTHNGVVYNTASTEYDSGTSSLTIDTAAGGSMTVNFESGAYSYHGPANVDEDTPEVFVYTIEDGDGDQQNGNLTIVMEDSVPVAYDNANQAMVWEVTDPGTPVVTMETLANFSGGDSTPYGGAYNPWIFDTSGGTQSVIDLGNTPIATAVASNGDKWISSSESDPYVYRVDFSNVNWRDGNTFDSNDTVKITINGIEYSSDGSNSGSYSTQRFDNAQASLESALEAAGYDVSRSSSSDRFDITTGDSATVSGRVVVDGSNAQTRSGTYRSGGSGDLDAERSSNRLVLEDHDGNGGDIAQLLSPEFTTDAAGSTTLSFDYGRNNTHSWDNANWKLFKNDGGTWVQVSGGGLSDSDTNLSTNKTVTTSPLDVSSTYRLQLEVSDGRYSSKSQLSVDNIRLTNTVAGTPTTNTYALAVLGNVLTDANTHIPSNDPWGAVDSEGVDGAALMVWDGGAFIDPTVSGTTIVGTYGSLEINSDGSYEYTPTADINNLGEQDVFTYQLAQTDGDTDDAQLVITIGGTPYVEPTPIVGDDETGTSGDDVILGTAGGDTLDGGEGDDHIEGGAGSDTIIGGKGDDVLFGGDDADTFVWNKVDVGGVGTPAHDTVVDFDASEGDVLNLADLLGDSSHTIVGIDNGSGDLQLNIKDGANNIVQEIELNGVTTGGNATNALDALIISGAIDDGII